MLRALTHAWIIQWPGTERRGDPVRSDSLEGSRQDTFNADVGKMCGGMETTLRRKGTNLGRHSMLQTFFLSSLLRRTRSTGFGQPLTSCSREELPPWLCSSGSPTGQVSLRCSTSRLRVLLPSRRMPSAALRKRTTRFSAKRRSARNTRRRRQSPSLTHQPRARIQ